MTSREGFLGTYMHFRKRGFAIAEVVVALFLLSMVLALVGGLGQQVMNFAKRSAQTSAILELRGMASTITREPSSWLNKMRSSAASSGLYAGCIPDMNAAVSTFVCPAAMSTAELQAYDAELAEIASGQYFALSAPIIDYNGNVIAGTLDAPILLNNEGRVCTNASESSCAFKSLGFFLRSNSTTDADPGNIKFVIKITKNYSAANASTAPMKNQYLSMEIGDTWKKVDIFAGDTCPAGTIKLGYLVTGQPRCINITDPCQNNQFLIGINSSGDSICKSIPNCAPTEHISLNSGGTDLVCVSQQTPCGASNIFLGYFAGSGEPICHGLNISCSAGELQVGVNVDPTGNVTAQCTNAPPTSCPDANQRVAFNGIEFSCQSSGVQKSCPAGKVMSGIDSAGEVMCVEERSTASVVGDCPDTADGKAQYLKGIKANGELNCQPLPSAGQNGNNGNDGNNGSNGVTAQQMCVALSGTWNNGTGKCALQSGPSNVTITPWTKDADSRSQWSSTIAPAATKGTHLIDEVTWRRVGDSMEMKWRYRQTTAGTNGKGVTLIKIPGGVKMDLAKLNFPPNTIRTVSPAVPVGRLSRHYGSTAHCEGTVYAYDDEYLILKQMCAVGGGAGAGWIPTYGGWSWADIGLSLEATFPIAGWQ